MSSSWRRSPEPVEGRSPSAGGAFLAELVQIRGSKLRQGIDYSTGEVWSGSEAKELGLTIPADQRASILATVKQRAIAKRGLLTDDEFRQLATQHHDLDERIHNLAARPYLSEPEQLEEVTLKKRKLQLKDQMESILRRHRTGAEPAHAAPRP